MNETIVFTGGGTGGHIYPGLAVAEYVKDHYEGPVVWIGSGSRIEREIVLRWNLPFYAVPSGKLRRYFSLQNAWDIFKILAGIAASFIILIKLRPAALFSKGGFVSVPPVIAARFLKIPVFTHESDRDPGLATRINSRFAETIFVAYEETVQCFPEKLRANVIVSGNPVRKEIYSGCRERGRRSLGVPDGIPVLLVLGGSQGALEINRIIRSIVPELCDRVFIVHQTGEGTRQNQGDDAAHPRYLPIPFIKETYPDILASADLVVSRSGAGSIWEIAVAGKPSVLIPLSKAGSRGDQVRNAELLRDFGAAVILDEDCRKPEAVLPLLIDLLENTGRLKVMAEASRKLGNANASELIGRRILKTVKERI